MFLPRDYHCWPVSTFRSWTLSHLFPITTKGNRSDSFVEPWVKNSFCQFSRCSNDYLYPIATYLWISDVKDEHTAIRTLVKCTTEAFESFLTGSIPDLQRNIAIIYTNFLSHEICANCRSVIVREFLTNIPE
jgi:hypothetical protein